MRVPRLRLVTLLRIAMITGAMKWILSPVLNSRTVAPDAAAAAAAAAQEGEQQRRLAVIRAVCQDNWKGGNSSASSWYRASDPANDERMSWDSSSSSGRRLRQSCGPGDFLFATDGDDRDSNSTPVASVAYCFNFKAGATTWMGALARFSPKDGRAPGEDELMIHASAHLMIAEPVAFRRALESGSYFTFLVVRHPLDRLLSAFRNRILRPCTGTARAHVPGILRQQRENPPPLKDVLDPDTRCVRIFPTFQEFLRFVVSSSSSEADIHWQPYHSKCAPCLVGYDAVVKLETAAADEAYVLAASGMWRRMLLAGGGHGDGLSLQAMHGTAGGDSGAARTEFYSRVPCGLVRRVGSAYRMDLELFEYDLEPFLKICREEEEEGEEGEGEEKRSRTEKNDTDE